MRIPFIKSLIEFDKRVLNQGSLIDNKIYSLEELQNLLFFNNVFISNTDEIFERHNCDIIYKDFVECLNVYLYNMKRIKHKIFEICRNMKEIDISRHSQYMPSIFQKIQSHIEDSLKVNKYEDIAGLTREIDSGKIYYLSISSMELISIDPESSVYKEPIFYDLKREVGFCNTLDAVSKYISNKFGFMDITVIRVIRDRNNIISKVEYCGHGDLDDMKKIFGADTLIVQNPFLYTNDLAQLIDKNGSEPKPIEIQSKMHYDLNTIFERDILIEYPLDSFMEFLAFLSKVVNEWGAKRIYLTLYRIGSDPAIFNILQKAIKNGIEVNVNIELCATGESINQYWANELRRIGANVITFGYRELKVHSKTVLIDLLDGRSIAQIGTGNYHTKTTLQYTDLSLITSNQDVCKEVRKLFKVFNDKSTSFQNNFLVTRYNFLDRFISMIRREGAKGPDGLIVIKCNALDDDEIIHELQEAADNGCKIIAIIRGVCTWIPSALHKNVFIKSIIWDKLEHSRVYSFGNINPSIYMGSLDLVTNKIHRRIETLVKVTDPDIVIELCDYLNRYITSTKGSWIMMQDGSYVREE